MHQSGEDFKEHFDVFEKIDEYEKVMIDLNCTIIEGYNEVKEQILQLKAVYKTENILVVSSYNDTTPENFVKSGDDKLYLIDS
ncbi:phosphotransferase family protein [Planococcus shixiaomingii]|uniref:phosphotransferase family protein n=1 Tax=Planococcus shixiaomingii TaxID=3058393 RepID=UPI003F70F884